eukprot:TRINITY_DN4918_c0_g1_i3.p1 TRINITY_DN4918_c0_g1~~TRINITY_DN4918_c0_g1_i3.p1  ORF type:complete len:214 (+),score=13.49 TRINITY_DN4918_c0_g1_i3:152-793(+)
MCIRDRYQRRVRGDSQPARCAAEPQPAAMTVFDFWVFNRFGTLLYYEQWHRSVQLASEVQEVKLMHGLIYMLKQFSQKISPRPDDAFCSFKTPDYRLHFFESGTGLQFVMRTDPNQNYAKVRAWSPSSQPGCRTISCTFTANCTSSTSHGIRCSRCTSQSSRSGGRPCSTSSCGTCLISETLANSGPDGSTTVRRVKVVRICEIDSECACALS